MNPNMSALAQAMQVKGKLNQQAGGDMGNQQQQAAPQTVVPPNALEQMFAQFLQQQHSQTGTSQSFINFLPWFSQSQGAIQPPSQQSSAIAEPGSGQALGEQMTQDQSNKGGDMSSRFAGIGY
jgi:hypothetical protein